MKKIITIEVEPTTGAISLKSENMNNYEVIGVLRFMCNKVLNLPSNDSAKDKGDQPK